QPAEARAAESRALQWTYDPESYAVGVGIRRDLVPVGAPQHPDIVIHPRPATNDPQRAGIGTARIPRLTAAVVVGAIPVGYPFPPTSYRPNGLGGYVPVGLVPRWRLIAGSVR